MKKPARRKPRNGSPARPARAKPYELRLFVTGSTPRSLDAIARIRKVCETHLKGRYTLEVVDVHQQPHLAERDQIIALPTLMRKLPLPLRKILGTFAEEERLLGILGISAVKKP